MLCYVVVSFIDIITLFYYLILYNKICTLHLPPPLVSKKMGGWPTTELEGSGQAGKQRKFTKEIGIALLTQKHLKRKRVFYFFGGDC